MKNLKRYFIVLLILTPLHLRADNGYLYESNLLRVGKSYRDLLAHKATDQLTALPSEQKGFCEKRYAPIMQDGVLDIRIALGYFDWTTGNSIHYNGANYGPSPSIDIGAYYALRALLTSRCYGNLQFCGFTMDPGNPYRFHKNVFIHKRSYRAQVEMHFSSVTEYFSENTGYKRGQQNERTSSTEGFFGRSLRDADAIFYFGHARNGGGPDFAPPILVRGKNKVDYNGYYLVHRPGLNKMVSSLRGAEKQAPILGLMACNSRVHFLNSLRKAAPNTGVISSWDVTTIDEVYTATIGAVDALLRGQCQKSFYQSLRMTARNQRYITMDGMFE